MGLWKYIAEKDWWEKKLKKTGINFEKFKSQEEVYAKHDKVISGFAVVAGGKALEKLS